MLNAESVSSNVLRPGSVFGFLAEHRRTIFPEETLTHLFPTDYGTRRPVDITTSCTEEEPGANEHPAAEPTPVGVALLEHGSDQPAEPKPNTTDQEESAMVGSTTSTTWFTLGNRSDGSRLRPAPAAAADRPRLRPASGLNLRQLFSLGLRPNRSSWPLA